MTKQPKLSKAEAIKEIEHTHYDYNACEMGYCDCPEIERPMNDTEYIEYLEKENQELKARVEQVEMWNRNLNNKQTTLMEIIKGNQDQFLKVVESVLKEHGIISTSAKYIICSCLLKFDDSSFYKEHLLQEIKSAMEKGNNE